MKNDAAELVGGPCDGQVVVGLNGAQHLTVGGGHYGLGPHVYRLTARSSASGLPAYVSEHVRHGSTLTLPRPG